MKKLLIFIFGLLFSAQSFATSIDSGATSAPCDNDILGQTSGTVNMEIDWQPNTINVRWYNGNTLINTINGAENSCIYDDDLYLPTTPTKKGYTFEGWEVRSQYDFSTLNTNITGEYAWSKNWTVCLYGNTSSTKQTPCNNSDFDDLNVYEWKSSFSYGMLYGMVKCTTTPESTIGKTGSPDETSNGLYCWCKATGFKPTNSDTKYAPVKSPRWTYIRTFSEINSCYNYCADWCSFYAINNLSVRTAFFY